MDVLVIETDLARPDTVVAQFSARTPRNVRIGTSAAPDAATAAWAAEDPTVSATGSVSVMPDTALGGWFAAGEGYAVSATGDDVTVDDTVRGGFPPVVTSTREPLFQTNKATLVTGLKDTNTPGQQRRTITMEEF